MLTTASGVRVLGPADLPAFLALTALDPVVNVFADYRARTTRLDPRWLGGEMLGRFREGELVAALHVGANLVPVQATDDDVAAFATELGRRPPTCATIVGRHEAVEGLWERLRHGFDEPRETRWRQPHLQISTASTVDPDPLVRRTNPDEVDWLYPACVAMYTEEVGVSPEAGGGAALYRARVNQLVARGWSFVRFGANRKVLFKAEVACATPSAAQVQGVYVDPAHRGHGLATAGMAAVIDAVRRDLAPTVSLYVNEWNLPARHAYEKVGFTESARFSTVMF